MMARRKKAYKRYLDKKSHEGVPASSWYRFQQESRSRMNASSSCCNCRQDNKCVKLLDEHLAKDNNAIADPHVAESQLTEISQIDQSCGPQLAESHIVHDVIQSLTDDIDRMENEGCNVLNTKQNENVPHYTSYEFDDEEFLTEVTDSEAEPTNRDDVVADNFASQRSTSLTDAIESGTFRTPITTAVNKTVGEVVLMILKYALVHALSLTEATDLFLLVNSIFAEPIIAHSRFFIDKLFFPKNDMKLYATCSECGANIGRFKQNDRYLTCQICNTVADLKENAFKNFFVMLDVASPIAKLIESNSEYYNNILHNRVRGDGYIRDIYDGIKYQAFVDNLSERDRYSYATVTFNTDGARLFESSSYSIWPIFLMVNEVPFHVRTKELILAGLWFGKDKPNMTVFLEPFVKHMNELSDKGVECTVNEQKLLIKICTLVCCVDAVARAPVHGFTQFNGSYGCGQCLHPGEWVRNDPSNPRSGNIKYPLLNIIPKERNVPDTIQHMSEAVNSNRSIFGVKCASPLINLEHYDIIHSNVVDSLHCGAGIAKQFATMWFGNNKKTGLQPRSIIKKIDIAMKSIKAPHQVVRLARPFSEKEFWKAREWENWIMFYSTVVLRDILPDGFFTHWTLFVEGFYILSKGELTLREVATADDLLRQFVGKCEILYGKPAMTFNVHSLVHLARSVADWGPLWAHNAYAFESGNGDLLKVIHAAKGVYHQICRRIHLKYSFIKLKDHVFPFSSFAVRRYCDTLGNLMVKQTFRSNQVRYFGSVARVDEFWSQRLTVGEHSVCYQKIVKNGCLYVSMRRANNRSNNSYAMLVDNSYVRILHFIVDSANQKEHTIVQKIETTNAYNTCHMLREIVAIENVQSAISTGDITKICVHMQINNRQYLCAVPNLCYS